jgi:hypothetical protein
MQLRLIPFYLLLGMAVSCSLGCSSYRQVSRPELWGMSLPETWEYDLLRSSGKSHSEARRFIRQRRNEMPAWQEREVPITQHFTGSEASD